MFRRALQARAALSRGVCAAVVQEHPHDVRVTIVSRVMQARAAFSPRVCAAIFQKQLYKARVPRSRGINEQTLQCADGRTRRDEQRQNVVALDKRVEAPKHALARAQTRVERVLLFFLLFFFLFFFSHPRIPFVPALKCRVGADLRRLGGSDGSAGPGVNARTPRVCVGIVLNVWGWGVEGAKGSVRARVESRGLLACTRGTLSVEFKLGSWCVVHVDFSFFSFGNQFQFFIFTPPRQTSGTRPRFAKRVRTTQATLWFAAVWIAQTLCCCNERATAECVLASPNVLAAARDETSRARGRAEPEAEQSPRPTR